MSARTEATVVVNAPMDLVWDMTNDLENWPNLFTEYAKVEILHREGDTVRFELTMHPDENGSAHSWVSERTADRKTRTVHAHRVESHAFDFMNLFWTYTQLDEGVEMTWVQEFHVNEAMSYGDEDMANHLKKNTAIQMAAVKERIEEAAQRQ
ncbi:SRPBCC family protein [Nonomuraea sp. NPDC050556]|uniref:SRPBCC family protein n=1 Tax=Nonomuraea sp. NPDC050556 TaxID=3364369 RepID=UPI00379A4A7A